MKKLSLFSGVATLFFIQSIHSQTIGTFISVQPTAQTEKFVLPSTHRFQVLAQTGDALTGGGMLNENPDFTCYVPIANSSTQGYISLNHETAPGGVTIYRDMMTDAIVKVFQDPSVIKEHGAVLERMKIARQEAAFKLSTHAFGEWGVYQLLSGRTKQKLADTPEKMRFWKY